MKKLQRFISTILCIVMCAGMALPTFASSVPSGVTTVDELLATFDEGSYTKIDITEEEENVTWGWNLMNNKVPNHTYVNYLGEDCVKLDYCGDSVPWSWMDSAARYMFTFTFKSANALPTTHKHMVVTYASDSAGAMCLWPVAYKDNNIYSDVSASAGKWACTDVFEFPETAFERINTPSYDALYIQNTNNNSNIYIESIIFFADADDAATYAELAPILMDPNYVPEEPEEPEPSEPTDAVVTFEVVTEEPYYNVGDTIEATIVATASEDIDVYSVEFDLVVPEQLTMGSLVATDATENAKINDGFFAWAYDDKTDNCISLTTSQVPVATVTFTVNDTLGDEHIDTVEPKITVSDAFVGLDNGNGEAVASAVPLKIDLYDIEITVTGENTNLEELGITNNKLYAKYDESGLYTDEARTKEDLYDLTTKLEADEGYAITGYQFDNGEGAKEIDLDNFPFVESGTLKAITTEKVTVTINVPEGTKGTVDGYDEALLEVPGQTLEEILTQNNIKAEPINENYEFVGWYNKADNSLIYGVDEESLVINADIIIYPVFKGVGVTVTPEYLNFFKAEDAENYDSITGADTITVDVAKYGEPLKVTVGEINIENEVYFLENVTYTQGDAGEIEMILETEGGNVYVSTDALDSVEPITVTAYYSKRVTVTFDDDGAVDFKESEQTVFYAKQYERKSEGEGSNLYIDEDCTEEATTDDIPEFKYVENDDIKSVEKDGEEAWLIGEENYANAGLLTFVYEGDTTIKPNADTAYRITFTFTEGGVISGLDGTVEFWRKSGATMNDIILPEIIIENNSEQYNRMFVDEDRNEFDSDATITGPATYTAVATPKSHKVSLDNADNSKYQINVNEGTYGVDLEVTISLKAENTGYIVPTTVTYKVEDVDGEPKSLDVDVNGKFTIPGADITDVITVYAEETKVTYTLTVPENVTVNGKATGVTVEFQVDNTVTIEAAEGVLISGITYTVGDSTDILTAEYDPESDVYKLDPATLVGNVTLNVTTLDVTFGEITVDEYYALEKNTKILLVIGADADKVVALKDGTKLYWSGKYNDKNGAHVAIVDDTKSDNDLANGMTVTDATEENKVVAIAYEGDVNGSGDTRAADAAYVSYILHQSGEPESVATFTDLERLEADFNGDGTVSTKDCQAILNKVVGITEQGN